MTFLDDMATALAWLCTPSPEARIADLERRLSEEQSKRQKLLADVQEAEQNYHAIRDDWERRLAELTSLAQAVADNAAPLYVHWSAVHALAAFLKGAK